MRLPRGSSQSCSLALALSMTLVACGGPRVTPTMPPQGGAARATETWVTALDRDHPLVGRVWDVARRTFIEPAAAISALSDRRFLLLGEKHDNADHHVLQAKLVHAFAAAHPDTVVAFEMFDIAQQASIDAYRSAGGATAEGFGPAMRWEESGWPAWSSYLPVAKVAFAKRLPILGANLPTERVRAVARHGLATLGGETITSLGLDAPFPPDLEASLLQELRDSHCGHLPESALPRMAAAQHARDAQMARALVQTERAAVLVAGAGHARKDHGVPYFLRKVQRDPALTSIAFVEVSRDVTAPELYASRFGAETLPFDLVWFTPRAHDEDPCAAFHPSPKR